MIFFTTTNIDTFNNPTIIGLLEKLVERKISAKVVTNFDAFKNPLKEIETIQIWYIQNRFDSNFKRSLKQLIKLIIFHLKLIKLVLDYKPKLIIGIDANGLILGKIIQRYTAITQKKKAKLDFLSFEILFKDEGADKKEEIRAAKQINNLIVQDPLRDELLRAENHIRDTVKSFYIPVSPLLKKRGLSSIIKENSVRDKYHLQPDFKLIIHFGSFDDWSGAEWIISAIEKGLPNNIIIIIHSRYKLNKANKFYRKILKLAKTNNQLILSDTYIRDYEDAIEFLRQFDVGLALYVPNEDIYKGKNIYNIGYASGKFSSYMAAGIPVIASSLPTYTALNSNFNFGFTVENEKQFLEILHQSPDFKVLKSNCLTVFEKVLNPSESMDRYIDYVLKN